MACNTILDKAVTCKDANCAWVAPWFKQAKIAYRFIRRALAKVKARLLARKSDSELRFEFHNGSVIQFFSAENYESIRGDGYHFIVIDEAADALRNPKMWTDAIRPALSDTNGYALIIGTPKGQELFFQLFNRGNDPEYPDWESFHAKTEDNPYIPKEEIEAAKKELPEDTFLQEYDAHFLEESAGVFRRLNGVIKGTLDENYQPNYWHKYAIGWDPAKYNDYSVITVYDVKTNEVVWWDRFNQIDYTYQVQRVVSVAIRFNHAFVLMDGTGVGDVIFEQLWSAYNNCDAYVMTNPSKKTLIETLQLAIQDRTFTMPDIPVVVAEMRQFMYKLSPSRNVIYSAPDGCHDDCVISLALVCYAAKERMPLDDNAARAIQQYVTGK